MSSARAYARSCLLLVSVAFIAATGGWGCTTSKDTASTGADAPRVDVRDSLTGQKVTSDDLKGKVLFVNFWATWCPPCREELPSIEALHRSLGDRPDFRMITILYNDSSQNGIGLLRQNNLTVPVYEDPGGVTARKFGITGVPETYIIDKKGVLKRKVIGALDWNAPEEKSALISLLSQ